MKPKIAYIMSRFPHLPETFILREMSELERQGWQVALYPLIAQEQTVIHDEVNHWLPQVRRLPFASPAVLAANGQALFQSPARYGEGWMRTLFENRTSPKFLVRALALLPKAVYAARLMQQEGVDHIHAHYATHPAMVAWLIHKLTDISYSITVHAHDIFVEQAMLATKLRDATFIAAISHYNRDFLAQTVGTWVREKTHIVHCGIEPDNYMHLSKPSAGSAERFELISIGSLQPYKGHPYLIQACALLRDRGIPVRCRIIGGGEEQAMLERMITEARLEGIVELLGPQPQEEVARLLPTAHCYVQPSIITPSGKMEGIPVALMEALACALPVVATNISGIPELVQPDKTGYLVPPANASALADTLTTIYANPERACRLGMAGQSLVFQEFDLKTNVKNKAALFEKVIEQQQVLSFPKLVVKT
ncbi:MAG: glycosyltransferase family 4 protein [Anaerolineae bacterium]|nr:glycosyltransferase family 4 protein [Anaerolineae bacterium]